MIRKFECKNCKKQFEADDGNTVVCPHCKSDNVEIGSSRHFPLWGWIGIAIVIIALLAVFVLGNKDNGNIDTPIDEPELASTDTSKYHPMDPPTVSVSKPTWNKGSQYSVDVKAINVKSGANFYFVMLSHFDKKVLMKNDEGHFSNIPFCAEDGHSYDFAIMDSKADTFLCVPVQVTDFVKIVEIEAKNKMTAEQLQKLIDTQDASLNGVGESDYLSPDYKLEFTGIPADEEKPESWTDVFERLEYEIWSKVTVIKLDYDANNQINKITLKVTK